MSDDARMTLYRRAFNRAKAVPAATKLALAWAAERPTVDLFSRDGYCAFCASLGTMSPHTIGTYARSVRTAWKWAWREGKTTSAPDDLPTFAVKLADRSPRESDMPCEVIRHYATRMKLALGTLGTCRLLGVSQAQLSRVLNGKASFGADIVDGLERVYVTVMFDVLDLDLEQVARMKRIARMRQLRQLDRLAEAQGDA